MLLTAGDGEVGAMWSLLKALLIKWVLRTLGPLAVLIPIALALKAIGWPVVLVVLVLALPVLAILALVGLPVIGVVLVGGALLSILFAVLAVGVAVLKVVLPIVLIVWLLRWLLGSGDAPDRGTTSGERPAQGTP